MERKCIWCLMEEPKVSFIKKAHTIPKSLGGRNLNKNICDKCNEFFGNRNYSTKTISIEEALKEAFTITRGRLINEENTTRKIGHFRSKFFKLKLKNGKYNLDIKTSFKFSKHFQENLCRQFKRGLYKMFFEEYNRQKGFGFENKFSIVREFARYDLGDLPVFYFKRKFGALFLLANEVETPKLVFDRMSYLYSNDKFVEIEFLGHVFGFPIRNFTILDFDDYIKNSLKIKTNYFKNVVKIERLTDIDLTMSFFDK